jgi:hypothetical protein
MPNLTQEQIDKYFAHSGQHCPFCNSDQIQAGEMGVPNYHMAYQDVQCLICQKTWTDEYRLVGVTVSEE